MTSLLIITGQKMLFKKLLKINADASYYSELPAEINTHITKFEQEENSGFFKRFWNKMRARFKKR